MNRPKNEKDTEMLSYLIINCDYGIYRIRDEWTIPNKMEYLRSRIANKFPQAKHLVIKDFVVYYNMQFQLREGSIYRSPLIWSMVESDVSTDAFTMYTPAETPYRYNILIGNIRGNLDGKPFSVRHVEMPFCPDRMEKCDGLVARLRAIKQLIERLASQIFQSNQSNDN